MSNWNVYDLAKALKGHNAGAAWYARRDFELMNNAEQQQQLGAMVRLGICETVPEIPADWNGPSPVPHRQTITTAAKAAELVLSLRAEPRNVLLLGSGSSGRTMLARRIGAGQPPLEGEGLLALAWARYGALRHTPERAWDPAPPFRAPHYSCSVLAVTGSFDSLGRLRPGEITLAHDGTLFLDELVEWRRNVVVDQLIEVFRAGRASFEWRRAGQRLIADLPARPRLIVASSTWCPCGGVPEEIGEPVADPGYSYAERPCKCDFAAKAVRPARKCGVRQQAHRDRLWLDFWDQVINVRLTQAEMVKMGQLPVDHILAEWLYTEQLAGVEPERFDEVIWPPEQP